jgi:hypothetical protein
VATVIQERRRDRSPLLFFAHGRSLHNARSQVGLAGVGAAITLVLTAASLLAMNVDLPMQEDVDGATWVVTASVLTSAALLLPAAGGGVLWWRLRR